MLLGLGGFLFRKQIKKTYHKLTDSDKIKFINLILPSANLIGNKIGVPPLFIVAQLALESNWGKSILTTKYFNFGGIKATAKQPSVLLPTTEVINGVTKKVNRYFAVFPSVLKGLEAQSKIYQNKYFRQYLNKTQNPLKYARLIQSGQPKYATALNYVEAIKNALNEVFRLK